MPSLEDLLNSADSPASLLRHSPIGPYAFPVVRHEFSNWRDEQRSWRETCALFDQSHHMTDLYIEGPDTTRLLAALGINSFRNFEPGRAKQFVACNPDGYVIGDAILFCTAEDRAVLVGRPPAINWVEFHAETGDYAVDVFRDERSLVNAGNRRSYRYQVQGPAALDVLAAAGASVPDIGFFRFDRIEIGGRTVNALRHGMVGAPGFELFGPWDDGDIVKTALVEAGRRFGLQQVGARTYPTSTLESGWIPSPCPAVYTGEALRGYREWLPDGGYEGSASLGGSFVSDDIEDYYVTPYDLGYGSMIRFDHDFIGRQALEQLADQPQRRKVTLVWDGQDVARAMGSLFLDGDKAKYIDLPLANYATLPYDEVKRDGKRVGLSMYAGYSTNEGAMLSLATIDSGSAEPGTKVALVWGEPDGGGARPTVEAHRQVEIAATVGPAPYASVARETYRPS